MISSYSKIRRKAKEDIIIAVLFILLAIIVFIASFELPEPPIATSGPAFWPRVIASLMTIMSLFLIGNALIMLRMKEAKIDNEVLKEEKASLEEDDTKITTKEVLIGWWVKYKKPLIAIFATFIFYLFFRVLGFILSVFSLGVVIAFLVESDINKKSAVKIILQSVVMTIGMYYLFAVILSVRMPGGLL